MGAVKQNPFALNIVATAAVAKKVFVSPAGATAAAGGNSIGVNDYGVASGETMLVDHLGMTTVFSGAAVPANTDRLMSDANGKAIPWTNTPATNVAIARLASMPNNSATAANQEISVILIPN